MSATAPTKKNGEKGAEAHTVSEKERIKFTKILMDLREDDTRPSLEFPSDLTNTERKFVHLLASQLGLVSKSSGKGEQRKITVSKRNEHTKKMTTTTTTNGEDFEQLPILNIGRGGTEALMKHISKFPPTHMEEIESKETGASLLEAMKKQQQQSGNSDSSSNIDSLTAVMEELGKGGPREAPKVEVGSRSVDVKRRIERHAYYQQMKRQQYCAEYHRVVQNRSKLPAFARQDEVVLTVANNPVTIIQGGTYTHRSGPLPIVTFL
jgi:HrpA-like RNA helicase